MKTKLLIGGVVFLVLSLMCAVPILVYAGSPQVELAGRRAWPEHRHFSKAKDEDGIQTLFAKVKNIGTGPTSAKVQFKISRPGATGPEYIHVTTNSIAPGEIALVELDYPQDSSDLPEGKYSVVVKAQDSNSTWGNKMKSFRFTVVP